MIGNLLKRIFGGGTSTSGKSATGQAATRASAEGGSAGQPDPEGFVQYVVRSLVDSPDEVRIKVIDGDSCLTIQVSCAKKDIGKIIGRSGKTIGAIRALASGAGGRTSRKVNVEVMD